MTEPPENRTEGHGTDASGEPRTDGSRERHTGGFGDPRTDGSGELRTDGSIEPLGFGILGCGVIGASHASAIADVPDARLVAVADTSSERARRLAERYGVIAYESLADMLQRPEIRVVSICTPSGAHADGACETMLSGRHVLVEKPIDVTLPRIDRMLEIRRERGVKLGVVFQHRWDAAVLRVRRLLDEGALGRIVMGNAHVLWWRSQGYYDSAGWRGTWRMDGGGVLMNQAIHSIDLLTWLMGPIAAVRAHTATLAHRMETEDTAAASLRFRSGALGTVAATTAAYPGVTTRVEIMGDNGSAQIEDDRLALLYIARDAGEEVPPYGLDLRRRGMFVQGNGETQLASTGSHAQAIADMVDAIRRDRPPMVDGTTARHVVEVILAIYESQRTGREVQLP